MLSGVCVRNEETRKILSEARKGQIPWNKGKTGVYSEETLKLMREAKRGEKNPWYGKKGHWLGKKGEKHPSFGKGGYWLGKKGKDNPNFGKKRSEETRKLIKENNARYFLGKNFSEEHRKNISEAMKGEKNHFYGKKHTEKARKNMSEARKGEKNHNFGKNLSEKTRKLISEALKGKTPSEKTKRKLSEALKGEKNPNWKGGVSPKNQQIRASLEYKLWEDSVLAKNSYTCQKCGEGKIGKIMAHHIQNFAQFPELRFAINNGITFCRGCHTEFHKIYGKRNNTKEQIEEFLNPNKVGTLQGY